MSPYSTCRRCVLSLTLLWAGAAAAAAAEPVDLIITAAYVVTMDDQLGVVRDAAVAVNQGTILAVGPIQQIEAAYTSEQRIDGPDHVVLPGLINGHTHAAMTLFRGIADDLSLMDWLTQYIFPAEIRFVDERFVRLGTQLACLEMIKGGTTAFVDMYFHPKEIASVVEQCGLRAIVSASVIEQESGYTKNFDDAMSKGVAFIKAWKGRNSRITPALAAHSAYTVTPDNLKRVRQQALILGVPVATHLSESQSELEIVRGRYGNTSVNLMDSIGFFAGPTIAAHVVWPTQSEIALLAKRNVGVVHNPTSNLKTAAGISPVPEMLEAGVAVGLGTDGAASNNDLDMWDEIRLAALIHKTRLMNPKAMPAATVLKMATITGARSVGLDSDVGSLTPGKRADMIQVSLDDPHLVPMYDIISHLVYAVDAQDVQTVIVDGRIVMRERVVLTMNEAQVKQEARILASQISAALLESSPVAE